MDKYKYSDDSFRESAELERGVIQPRVSTRPLPQMSDNEAYNRQGVPDGLQNDGNQPSWYGKTRDACGDNAHANADAPVIRHNDNQAHPGFAAVQGKIEHEGYSKNEAGAILANASRHASAAAKEANPRLKKV